MRNLIGYIAVSLLAAAVPFFKIAPAEPTLPTFPGWPTEMDGRPLQAIPLQDYESGFAQFLPGRLAKFTDGAREYMIQWIGQRTRLIHPATDCLANAGYHIEPESLWVDEAGNRWSSAIATRGEVRVRVRERIYDNHGQSWHDHSSWYWSVTMSGAVGPWWVVTVIESCPSPGQP